MAEIITLELGACRDPAQLFACVRAALRLPASVQSLSALAECFSEPLGDIQLQISGVSQLPPPLRSFFFDMMDVFDDATRLQSRWRGCGFDYMLV